MPLTKIDYSNTIIYKLCCKDLNITDVYVGHTTDFRRRKNSHKTNCNKEKSRDYDFKVYQFIRDNGSWDNWDMIEIERFEAIDGNDAKKRERYWIETLKANLNNKLPSRTKKEYYKDNKETLVEKHKEYYENNKETLAEKHKEYYENNKEIIKEKAKEYYQNNLELITEKKKNIYEKNKTIISEKAKEYYEKNKIKINEKAKVKIQCECGCEICIYNLSRHKQSKKHIDLMSMINDTI
jgi:hypothetical protein